MKPWFQIELERATQEKWRVTVKPTAIALMCGHGMKVFVPYPLGQERPFLNLDAERNFVGKILPAHRPWAEVKIPWPTLRY